MRRMIALVVVLLALSSALLGFALVGTSSSAVNVTPSAAEFGHDFVATANAYALAHASAARLTNPDCVQASRGRYMCSYAISRPGRAVECHVMQARWTPDEASTFTVTLAGRTTRCESLRAALAALG